MICWKSWKVASGFKLAWCIQPKIALPNADYREGSEWAMWPCHIASYPAPTHNIGHVITHSFSVNATSGTIVEESVQISSRSYAGKWEESLLLHLVLSCASEVSGNFSKEVVASAGAGRHSFATSHKNWSHNHIFFSRKKCNFWCYCWRIDTNESIVYMQINEKCLSCTWCCVYVR